MILEDGRTPLKLTDQTQRHKTKQGGNRYYLPPTNSSPALMGVFPITPGYFKSRAMQVQRLPLFPGHHGGDIFLRGADGGDSEFIHKDLNHIGREKSRQGGSQPHPLYPQVQQGQGDGTAFCSIPRQCQRRWAIR